jgi:putative colanic acid biosynthesis UDP-glucose lipid carrier transferase
MIVNNIESYNVNRAFLFSSIGLFGLLLVLWKILFITTIKHSTIIHGPLKKAVIVGGGVVGTELYHRFKNLVGYEFLGLFDDEPAAGAHKELYLGDIDSCMNYVVNNEVDEIFCALPLSRQNTIESLIKSSDKNLIRLKLIPEHYDYFQGRLRPRSMIRTDIFSIRAEPMENIFNRAVKRLFDVVFSLVIILFVFSWLFPIVYILISIESPGPVFFTQPRSGRDNTTFNCYKFRSMYINTDSDRVQASRGDSRITRVGAFLRKTSLDEMPQFFNVLLGNMSVVGPRPHMLSHTREYSNLIDHFMVRHFIKPGITGWAQINGLRGETKTLEDMRARVEADVWYMENWSFNLDLKIIFSTFFKTIAGDKYAF